MTKKKQLQSTITNSVLDNLVKQAIQAANIALRSGNFFRCEELMRQVAMAGAADDQTKHLLALACHRQGKNIESREILEVLVKECPDNWEFWNSLGVINSSVSQPSLAIVCFKNAIKANPTAIVCKNNLALEYQALGNLNEAQSILNNAIMNCSNEHKPILWFNLGNLMIDKLSPKAAVRCYEKALELMPDLTSAQWNRATSLLMDNNYKDGWNAYEARWDNFPSFAKLREKFCQRQKHEKVDISLIGKRVLLYSEQGAGDTIQFLRFTKHLKEQGATVMMEWSDSFSRGSLTTLLKEVKWIDEVIDPSESEIYVDYDFDFHQSIASLPRTLGLMEISEFKCSPYIKPNTKYAPELDDHLWEPWKDKHRIGIVWAGNASHNNDSNRSCRFQDFQSRIKSLSVDFQVFSLQKDNSPRRRMSSDDIDLSEGLAESNVIDLGHMMIDYNATANLISKMDLIITVDTSVAHLAGAMGKRTFLLIPYVPDWRWGTMGDRTHWYQSIKMFRQPDKNNWQDPLNDAFKAAEYLLPYLKSDR